MAKKEKEYKLPNPKKRQPFYAVLKVLMRWVFKKPEILNLAGEIEDKSIILANHSAKSGPPSLDLYFPKKAAKWGAYQMFGNYASRKAYLRDVLYIQKCGKKAGLWTSFKASVLAVVNLWAYKGIWALPSYPDGRFGKTLRYSKQMLDKNVPVMLFPENSNDGYKEVLTDFFPGFVMLAEKYFRAEGVDLPVYPVYYSIPKRFMVIGKPLYVQDFVKEGLDRYQIAAKYCEAVNELYFDYVKEYQPKGQKTEKSVQA